MWPDQVSNPILWLLSQRHYQLRYMAWPVRKELPEKVCGAKPYYQGLQEAGSKSLIPFIKQIVYSSSYNFRWFPNK